MLVMGRVPKTIHNFVTSLSSLFWLGNIFSAAIKLAAVRFRRFSTLCKINFVFPCSFMFELFIIKFVLATLQLEWSLAFSCQLRFLSENVFIIFGSHRMSWLNVWHFGYFEFLPKKPLKRRYMQVKYKNSQKTLLTGFLLSRGFFNYLHQICLAFNFQILTLEEQSDFLNYRVPGKGVSNT